MKCLQENIVVDDALGEDYQFDQDDLELGPGDLESGSGDLEAGSGDLETGSGDVELGSGDLEAGECDDRCLLGSPVGEKEHCRRQGGIN